MASAFFPLMPTENRDLMILSYGSYLADYPSAPTLISLFDILSKRKTTLAFFFDIDTDGQTTGDSWRTVLTAGLGALYGRSDVTVLAVFGRLLTDVNVDYFGTMDFPVYPICVSNEAWANSFGSLFASSFDSPVPTLGSTPFTLLFSRTGVTGSYQYRLCDKFHMACLDTGDSDLGPAGSPGSKDLLAFTIGGATPTFPSLAPYLIRRVNDLNAIASPTATITAPAALDIGGSVRVGFDRKLIGPGAGANFAIGYSGAGPAVPAAGEFAYGAGASQLAIDGYLGTGESVVFTPAASALAAHAGGTLDLYAAESTAIPGEAAITDTMGIPYASADPAKPFLLGSAPIGTPKIFIRNYPSDDGLHAVAVYESPDIGVYHENSAEKSDDSIRQNLRDIFLRAASNTIYSDTEQNGINRILIRVLNSGSMRSQKLCASLFWTTRENLRKPAIWEQVGSTNEPSHSFFISSNIESYKQGSETCAVGVSESLNWTFALPSISLLNTEIMLIAVVSAENDKSFTAVTSKIIPDKQDISNYCITDDKMTAFLANRCVGIKAFHYEESNYSDKPRAPIKELLDNGKSSKADYINLAEIRDGFSFRIYLSGFGAKLGDTVQLRFSSSRSVVGECLLSQANIETGVISLAVPAGYDLGSDGLKTFVTSVVYSESSTLLESPELELTLDTSIPSVKTTVIKIK